MNDPLTAFPGLGQHGYRVKSPATDRYNCIAWAASSDDRWWWPEGYAYWPPGVPVALTLEAFEAAYQTLGYHRCDDGTLEIRFEKIAIFATPGGEPKHAARQVDSGKWTSKLGRGVDIEHAAADAVSGKHYGQIALFMRRRRATWRWPVTFVHHALRSLTQRP